MKLFSGFCWKRERIRLCCNVIFFEVVCKVAEGSMAHLNSTANSGVPLSSKACRTLNHNLCLPYLKKLQARCKSELKSKNKTLIWSVYVNLIPLKQSINVSYIAKRKLYYKKANLFATLVLTQELMLLKTVIKWKINGPNSLDVVCQLGGYRWASEKFTHLNALARFRYDLPWPVHTYPSGCHGELGAAGLTAAASGAFSLGVAIAQSTFLQLLHCKAAAAGPNSRQKWKVK